MGGDSVDGLADPFSCGSQAAGLCVERVAFGPKLPDVRLSGRSESVHGTAERAPRPCSICPQRLHLRMYNRPGSATGRRAFGPDLPVEVEVAGRTLASLISAGTDLAGQYQGERFPTVPGYASVFDWTQAP